MLIKTQSGQVVNTDFVAFFEVVEMHKSFSDTNNLDMETRRVSDGFAFVGIMPSQATAQGTFSCGSRGDIEIARLPDEVDARQLMDRVLCSRATFVDVAKVLDAPSSIEPESYSQSTRQF